MPMPTSNVRTRPDLAQSMLEFPIDMTLAMPIALDLFPVVEVEEAEGNQGLIEAKELLTPTGGPRTGEGGYLRNELQFTEQTWATEENGGEGVIDQRKKSKYKKYFDHESVVARLERFKAFQRREIRCATIANNAGNYSGQTTAMGTTLDNYDTALPVDKVEVAVQAVYERTGLAPNTMWMSWKTFRNLRHNDQVIARIASLGAGAPAKQSDISVEILQQVFDIEKILVGGMPYNNANINQAKSIASVWSDTTMGVCYVDRSGDLSMPTHFRTYHWGEDGSTMDGLVEDYFEDDIRKHIIRVRQDTQEKQVLAELGQLLTGLAS